MRRTIHEGIKSNNIQVSRLLELGCGDASLAINLAADGWEAYGIDIVPMAIEWAKEKAQTVRAEAQFQIGKAFQLPYYSETFDLVIDAACSHCIIGKDRFDFFAESYRVLRSGGLFISFCLCGDPPPTLFEFFDQDTRCLTKDGIAGRYIGLPESIVDEAKKARFQIQDWWLESGVDEQQGLVLLCKKTD